MGTAQDPTLRDDELLARYVERGLDQLESGETLDAVKLCTDHPHLADAVAESLGLVAVLPDLHRESRGFDSRLGVALADRYQIEARIGAGAMGAVYRGFDRELQRPVAIKLLHGGAIAGDRAELRFARESEVLAAVDSPQIVRVFDRGRTADGALFLVMELLDGVSLADVLQWSCEAMPAGPTAVAFATTDWLRQRLPDAVHEVSYLRQLVRWAADLASGLGIAHQRGVFHRDVKPSNLLLTTTGNVALVDFGIAARDGDGHLTATGTSIGTPWYMPPEQAAGEGAPNAQLDIYSLTATLYHLLALAPPFDDEPVRVLTRLQQEDPKTASSLHRGLPRDLEAILERGMQRDPRRRYPSAAALEADLRAFLEHRPVSVRPLGPLGRGLRRIRRAPLPVMVAVLSGLVLGLVLVANWAWQRSEAAERSRRHQQKVASLPALLSLESYPEKRLLVDRFEREGVLRLLDEILELAPADLGSRLLRAAVRIDLGDHDNAQADLARIAADSPSEYLRITAQRYADADREDRGLAAIDLRGLPEPETEVDLFVAGFHALRSRTTVGYQEALRWLTEAGEYLPARDLRLIAQLARGQYQVAHDAALILEGVFGGPTARTRHVIGASLVGLQRYEEALDPLRSAIELRPGRHGPLQNLGVAQFRLGNLEQAERSLLAAHEIRPWLWNTLDQLSQLYCAREQYDQALDWAEQIPATGSLGEVWRRGYALGHVESQRAFAAIRDGDRELAAVAAKAAIEWFKASSRGGAPKSKRLSMKLFAELLRRIIARDFAGEFGGFVRILSADPLHSVQLRNLAAMLPEGPLDALGVERLRLLFLELAAAVAPGDPVPRRAAAAQREQLNKMLATKPK